MRNVFFILLFMLCGRYVQAQSEFDMQIDPKKLNEYLRRNKPAQQKTAPLTVLQLPADTARYSHTIIQGDIYALPQDNMPCLRPHTNSYLYNQPNPFSPETESTRIYNMPVIKGKPFIWEKKR